MKAIILGGGPAGLAVVDEISANKKNFVLIERDKALGGLAQTLTWENFGKHDLGPHKIFSLDKNLVKRIEGLLPPGEWLTREKKSSIYMKGRYLPYPPSPFSLITVYGASRFAKMVADYGVAQFRNLTFKNRALTFKDDLEHRVGNGLYEGLFKPIAVKLWGDPAELDSKLSKGRVQTPSPLEVIGRLLKVKNTSEFEALTFRYPKGGLQRLWDSIRNKSQDLGEILVNHEVLEIRHDGKIVSSLLLRNRATNEQRVVAVSKDDFIFSTIPLSQLPSLMLPKPPFEVEQKIKDYIRLNDLLLVFLKVDRTSLISDSWVFVPDPEIIFHRLSEQKSFDPDMTPEGSIVCCEVMSHSGRPMANFTDDDLIERCLASLAKMGIDGFKVQSSRVIRLPKSYPVFRPGFEENLKSVLSHFDKLKNFRTVGRQGAFNYIGTLDAMDIGYGSAKWWLGLSKNKNTSEWSVERQRTEHYPVLD